MGPLSIAYRLDEDDVQLLIRQIFVGKRNSRPEADVGRLYVFESEAQFY